MDEFERIARFFRPLTEHTPEALGLMDDAAWLQPPAGHTLVVSADALVQGVHFFGREDPALIARKALRVNLSDLAAMGAEAYGYLLAIQLPKDLPESWLARFCEGLAEDQSSFGFRLFGGDSSVTTGPVTLGVTALGLLPAGRRPLCREGAKTGDWLMVSGVLGMGALGLRHLREQSREPDADDLEYGRSAWVDRYLLPEPRLALGIALHGIATAGMDISDGLVQDAGHLAQASGVNIQLDPMALPLMEGTRFSRGEKIQAALYGGDDYELLFTVPPARLAHCLAEAELLGLRCHRIGRVMDRTAGSARVTVVGYESATPSDGAGWRHFR